MRVASILIACLMWCAVGHAETIDFNKLVDAIYHAEGGPNTRHPYGILAKYKHTTPRQACMNTVKHKYRDWVAQGSKGNFIAYLGSKYAPIGADNDPKNMNKNWCKNVSQIYEALS